jgi:hypothetical protein
MYRAAEKDRILIVINMKSNPNNAASPPPMAVPAAAVI